MTIQENSTAFSDSPITDLRHAIVIGGSMAGLLAAHVLTDHFDQITILERGHYENTPQTRASTPQDRHVHILMMRGQQLLEERFPGLHTEMIEHGAHVIDIGQELALLGYNGWHTSHQAGHTMLTFTRPLLDWCIRRRLNVHDRIGLMEGCSVIGLLADPKRRRINGIVYHPPHTQPGKEEILYADLIIDASGRFSKTPEWLSALGYGSPEETVVNSFLGYSSRLYAIPESFQADWKALLLLGKPPDYPRSGVLLPVEGGRWLVTLAGLAGHQPPTDESGFLEFAQSLRSPLLYEAILEAQALSSIVGYRATENRLRHYDTMPTMPDELVVLGDAVCAFSPIYGQGISVAALAAEVLAEWLTHRTSETTSQFQQKLAKILKIPWLMATSEDFRWPQTTGIRPGLLTRFIQRYLNSVIAVATTSADVAAAFSETAHLLKPPRSLFHPYIAFKILTYELGLSRPSTRS